MWAIELALALAKIAEKAWQANEERQEVAAIASMVAAEAAAETQRIIAKHRFESKLAARPKVKK